LLVVIVIIGILVAIALPNFLKIKEKAKEAEVKQNLHSIQLSIERYATDNEGLYPYFLYGGDAFYNIGTAARIGGKRTVPFNGPETNPYDCFYPNEYPKAAGMGDPATAAFGDVLLFEGYLTKYPKDPFVTANMRTWFGKEGIDLGDPQLQGFVGCGGDDGTAMFNLGFLGEWPCLSIYMKGGDPNDIYLDFPGEFYYHPRFADGGTVTEHNVAETAARNAAGANLDNLVPPGAAAQPGYELISNDVNGYDLVGFGAATDEGYDIDWSHGLGGNYAGANHYFREGYLVNGQERNSFNQAGGFRERTTNDGFGDFYIIILNSGIDRKPYGGAQSQT
jgi:hypothetical protein